VRLACALALQDLVATRAAKAIDLWIGDEIDDALDSAGLERLMGVLEEKARDRGTVLVISHNDIKDFCRRSFVVTKVNQRATVTES
jgi:DNA repair exonuclease SbcCD ATPase subunit